MMHQAISTKVMGPCCQERPGSATAKYESGRKTERNPCPIHLSGNTLAKARTPGDSSLKGT